MCVSVLAGACLCDEAAVRPGMGEVILEIGSKSTLILWLSVVSFKTIDVAKRKKRKFSFHFYFQVREESVFEGQDRQTGKISGEAAKTVKKL